MTHNCMQGRDGSSRGVEKIARLHDNANFVRRELQAMGCAILGDDNSPVTVRAASCHAAAVTLHC